MFNFFKKKEENNNEKAQNQGFGLLKNALSKTAGSLIDSVVNVVTGDSIPDEFELDDVSYMNVVSRHHEHSELTEQSLNDRAFQLPEPMEDTVSRIIENRRLIEAIRTLPAVQRRRLVLYYFHDLTYEQIAKIEHCTIMPVKRSIDRAIIKLRQILS